MAERRRLTKQTLPSKGLIKLLGVRPNRIDKGPWETCLFLRRVVYYNNHVKLRYYRDGFAAVTRVVDGKATFLGGCRWDVHQLKRDLRTALRQKHDHADNKHPVIHRGT